MTSSHRSIRQLRHRFDEIYDSFIVGGGFFESGDYYKNDRERYWRSLELLCQVELPIPAKILEVGGGQIALICKALFGDDGTVADISQKYAAPLRKADIELVTFNLMDAKPHEIASQFDVIVMLEVIEHIPLPAHLAFERLKPLLRPNGVIFLTTPNLFRLRNVIRMIRGVEFLDRFTLPEPGQGLGHQLEYSASHLRWQLERAGMKIIMLKHDSLGRTGHSVRARVARTLLAPLDMRPIWRNNLVVAARAVSG
jgi:2-polyprenyl-3-methyl-5-hydroxy-6-metoxy-1,4-benzoquinol methylase